MANTTHKDLVTSDPSYDKRHFRRNRKKVELISRNIENPVESILDIGCNRGYLIKAMLDRKICSSGAGVEIDRRTLDPCLFENTNFALSESDFADYQFTQDFEIVFYLAVHHHIFAKYGANKAMEKWSSIINHCQKTIFFETGQLAERGNYYWKEALARHYPTDLAYFKDLLRQVGPRLKSVSLAGQLSIHGIRRSLIKIDLQPLDSIPQPVENEVTHVPPAVLSDKVLTEFALSVTAKPRWNSHLIWLKQNFGRILPKPA